MGWGKGGERRGVWGPSAQPADPSAPPPPGTAPGTHPHPSVNSAGGGGGVLAAPADPGGVPELTARGGVPGLRLSPGLAGVSARRLRVRGGGRGCCFHQGGGGGSAVGLIHRPRRETAQPGRRAAVFSLVPPPSAPAPAPPPRRTPAPPRARAHREPRGDPGADEGKWEGKQVVAVC